MKKRLFSIVLSLCMVLALMPQMVFAEEGTATELQNMLNKGDTVTLNKDYTITSTIEVNNTVTLDLNGHVITMTGIGSVIKVNSGGNLTLQDSDSTAEHDDTTLPAGGVITNYYPGAEGRGVLLDGGSFTMNGGTIYNCRSGNGGGVCVQNNGSFEMTGGAISKCFSGASGGGGVYVNNGSFTMTGGAMCYCIAEANGGGVCVQNNGSFEMTGGAIYDCVAAYGGGVAVGGGSFTMNGGSIFDCNAYQNGSAAGVGIDSIVNANGGTIKGTIFSDGQIQNTADSGGCTVFYGGIENRGTINGKTVTFKKDDNSTYAVEVVKNGNKAIEPIEPTREGYKLTGWYTDEVLTNKYDFGNAVTDDITLYAGWGLSVPFTTTVKQDGNVAPGETTFTLELVDNEGNVLSPKDIEVTASIKTNGAGSYDSEMVIAGSSNEVLGMLGDGVFVKQKGIDDSNWTVDPKVWYLIMEKKSSEDTNDDAIAELAVLDDPDALSGKYVAIYPAEYSETENGSQYEVISDEAAVEKMTFTNRYNRQEADPAVPEDTAKGDSDSNTKTDAEDSAKTGDDTNLALWIALMLLAGAGIAGTTIYTRRKRTNE